MSLVPMTAAPFPQLLLRALGQPEVRVGGERVVWPARSAEELLWYLHAHPGGKYRHDIVAQLWHLEDTPAAANRFRVALHRLRAVLGRPDAVTEQTGRYALHPAVLAASDTHAFYEALTKASCAESPHAREELLKRALAGVGGEYLPHLQGEWVEAARQEYRSATVRAYLELSALHCAARECTLAAQALAGAARRDPLIREDYHQRLMVCLTQTHDRYAATEHYRRYRHFLVSEIGDTPMPDTAELAERIKGGEKFCAESPFDPNASSRPD